MRGTTTVALVTLVTAKVAIALVDTHSDGYCNHVCIGIAKVCLLLERLYFVINEDAG